MNESQYKSYLIQRLSPHFEIRPEVEGRFVPYDTKVVIDYLMYPKPHLVERQFDAVWFGVEVKSPHGREGGNKKGLRVAYQAITYRWSEFDGQLPAFVLIYPGLDEFFGGLDACYNLRCLLQKANVGSFEFDDDKRHWRINVGSGGYFHSERGRVCNAHALLKRNCGSWI